MFILITIIHVIVSLFLVIVVLLQSGKAADLAGAFGGLGSQTVFGPRGSATVLTRATTISAVLFMLTSLTLALLSTGGPVGGGNDILDKITAPAGTTPATGAPAAPATPGATPTTATPPPGLPTSLPATVEINGKQTTIQVPVTPGPAPAAKDGKAK